MSEKNSKKISVFFKKNAFYFVLVFCILAIALAIILAVTSKKDNVQISEPPANQVEKPSEDINQGEANKPQDTPQVDVETIVFIMPVNGDVSQDYADFVFNETLKRYETHRAIDFTAEEGANVYAVWGGTVEAVEKSVLTGTSVIIDHGDGLKTVYNSLAEDVPVTVGQKVAKGFIIGNVGSTNLKENYKGAHLHFSVEEDGVVINPNKYLVLESK